MQGVGVIPIPSKMIKWRFLYISLTSFYYNPPFCPPNPLLINHIFFWKNKVHHTDVDITCFFQDAKSYLTSQSIKRVFWKCLTEPVKHLSCSLLQKKVNGLQLKTISSKKSTLDVWECPKEYQLLLLWILP